MKAPIPLYYIIPYMTLDQVVDTAGGMVQNWDAQELSASVWLALASLIPD